jgi:AraC-like DNA-binding protein
MCCPRNSIDGVQGVVLCADASDSVVVVVHGCKLDDKPFLLLSKPVKFVSIQLIMFYEPSTLASATVLVAASLREDYGVDPEPIYSQVGIPLTPTESPQIRYPLSKMRKLWEVSIEASGDPAIGLMAGRRAKPTHFYALGYSWLASSTLLDAMQRLTRYMQVMSTASAVVSLTETDDSYAIASIFPDPAKAPPKEGIDCGMTALLSLCDIVAEREIRPLRVELTCPATTHPEAYREALRAPILFDAEVGTIHFDKDVLRELLPRGAPDVAKATDRIAEQYIETLDPRKVASQVRQLLIALLPSGKADQELVSSRLNRSMSTLQRQLKSEGLSYRDVLESTQRGLAETYLRDKKYSQAQIAYMLGFSEQSNFSRAFKRWTSMSPKQYQGSTGQ